MRKICERCESSKPVDEFYRDSSRKDGLAPYCKSCRRTDAQQRYLRNASQIKQKVKSRRDADRLSVGLANFKMSKKQYLEILESQNGVCAICGKTETITWNGVDIRRLSVDHDHACCSGRYPCGNCNRGLLCSRCNITLGKVNDDIGLLVKMIEYLRMYND